MEKAPLRLLLVEDEAAHATAILRAFEINEAKTQVEVAHTLQEFRNRIATHPPDLALLDLNLPDGNAAEVLKNPPEAGPFPIVVMTSYGNEHVAVEAIKAGALDYVVKSVEAFAAMPRTVERALREWKLLTERRDAAAERERLIGELQAAMAHVKTLSGLLPICSGCKKIRDDQGFWNQVESYFEKHSEATFTHGLCPDCTKIYFPGLEESAPNKPTKETS